MRILSIILFSLLSEHCFAQKQSPVYPESVPLVLGKVEKIHSKELHETRTLNIYLPDGYSPDSAGTYPVIYLLDGAITEDFIHITGVVQFLTMIGSMPPSIIVGIANVDRKRDFTFPTAIDSDRRAYPTTGHSAAFIRFIENELQPFIQRKYKVNQYKAIIGQSLGGLLATEILLRKPELFTSYMIVSPSLWWDSESLLAQAPALIANQSYKNIQIYISVGSEGDIMVGDARKLVDILQASGKKNMKVSFHMLPAESHLTILHHSIYDALMEYMGKK
jgi:predicted alpha/beta superfamily hydrolase